VQGDDRESRTGADWLDPASGRSRLVDIRCGFAELARREADAAAARVADTRVQLDAQAVLLNSAQAAMDPLAIRADKERAHADFHRSIDRATSRDQVELAAASWLAAINRVNGAVRASQARIQREREAIDALATQLDRLTAVAGASRAMAESAAAACREAQASLAAAGHKVSTSRGDAPGQSAAALISAYEAVPAVPAAAPPVTTLTPVSIPRPKVGPGDTAGQPQSEEPEPPVQLNGSDPPAIVGLLRRDGATMSRLVDWLADADSGQRRRWQICLSDFVDAVVATAIGEGFFLFAPGNSFWDQLTVEEAREVARGLAALGYRYDGMGEFADGRVPGHRDLSMALGQAGLLTLRVRNWPGPGEAAELYRQVRVDPVALLAEKAPSITMGELVLMLGRRAEGLAELWNDWPRARPLLLRKAGDQPGSPAPTKP
jgi:hypothetical protein